MGIKGAHYLFPLALYLAITAVVTTQYGKQQRVGEDYDNTYRECQVHAVQIDDTEA